MNIPYDNDYYIYLPSLDNVSDNSADCSNKSLLIVRETINFNKLPPNPIPGNPCKQEA
jgi:hypothetical protein